MQTMRRFGLAGSAAGARLGEKASSHGKASDTPADRRNRRRVSVMEVALVRWLVVIALTTIICSHFVSDVSFWIRADQADLREEDLRPNPQSRPSGPFGSRSV